MQGSIRRKRQISMVFRRQSAAGVIAWSGSGLTPSSAKVTSWGVKKVARQPFEEHRKRLALQGERRGIGVPREAVSASHCRYPDLPCGCVGVNDECRRGRLIEGKPQDGWCSIDVEAFTVGERHERAQRVIERAIDRVPKFLLRQSVGVNRSARDARATRCTCVARAPSSRAASCGRPACAPGHRARPARTPACTGCAAPARHV